MFKSIMISIGSLAVLVGLVPLLVCLIYSAGAFGSVGPWAPGWGVVTLLLSPVALYFPFKDHLRTSKARLALGAFSALGAVPTAVLAANCLMWLSYFFGLYDYAQA